MDLKPSTCQWLVISHYHVLAPSISLLVEMSMAGHCHPTLLASSLMVRIRTFLQPTGNHIEGNDDTNILFSTTVYNKWCSAAAASSTSRTAYFIW
jgi:hypothetical protein